MLQPEELAQAALFVADWLFVYDQYLSILNEETETS